MGIGIIDAFENATTLIKNWATSKLEEGLATKVEKVDGWTLSQNNYSTADKTKVASMPNALQVVDNRLYLAQDSKIFWDTGVDLPEGGGTGSGPGSGDSGVSVENLTFPEDFSVAWGSKEVWIEFNFHADTRYGKAYVKNIDNVVLGHMDIEAGYNRKNIAEFITTSYNALTIVCVDSNGRQASNTLTYNITAATLEFTAEFNDAEACKGDSFTIDYYIKGDGAKTIYFDFDGTKSKVDTNASSQNATQGFDIKNKPHGVYALSVRAETTISGADPIKSKEYKFRIMRVKGDNAEPLISSVYDSTTAVQYDTIRIPFAVYHPTNTTPIVDLIVSQNGQEISRTQMTAERGKMCEWSTRSSVTGDVDFIISCAGAKPVTHPITIEPSPMDATVRQNNLVFELKAADRTNDMPQKDVWKSSVGDVSTTFTDVGWSIQYETFTITSANESGGIPTTTQYQYAVGTGWTRDLEGNTALRLSGDARATINYDPFLDDWMDGINDSSNRGRTLELEFAIRDVNNRDAVAISCLDNDVGLKVTADSAALISNGTPLVQCNYVDDEKIRVSFVLEKKSNGLRLITSYLNGVLSSACTFATKETFKHANSTNITVGTSDCAVDLYMIRYYDAALTHEEIKNNYIADTNRGDIWADNKIYVNNAINDALLLNKIPIMKITGELPSRKADTDLDTENGREYPVEILYTNRSSQPVISEKDVPIEVQGTSSEGYIRKNWKLKFKEKYQVSDGQIPTNVFCMKADYAEATSTHNTGHANYVHMFYTSDKVKNHKLFNFASEPPFTIDPRARTTIHGFPCVIFHKNSKSDSAYTFTGKYNFNFDKGSKDVFSFTATDENGNRKYPRSQSWEFAENKYDPCKFLTDPDIIPEGNGTKDNPGWEACFEDRCKPESGGLTDFKKMYGWVYYTDQTKATGSEIDPYTKQPIGEYVDPFDNTIIHTHDTAAYRRAKFRKEFQEHFHLGFTLVYYVYTFVMLMVDQRAKNQFLTSWDGQIWHPWLYDNDTSFGINNQGYLKFDYYHEDIGQNSVQDQTFVYNGHNSVLWVNFADTFAEEIKSAYSLWRSEGLLTYDNIIKYFITDQSDKWSISIYNEDAEYKYISMYRNIGQDGNRDATNLFQVRGTGEEHLKYFVKNRLMYCDSKWHAGDFVDKDKNTIRIRISAPDITDPDISPTSLLIYQTFSNMYAAVGSGSKEGISDWKYTPRNTDVKFELTVDKGQNNLDVYIFGASEITEIQDISRLYCDLINVNAASKLTKLIIGNKNPNYVNGNLEDLSLSNNRLLRELNICNCTGLTKQLDLSLCPDIQYIYATGSRIPGVTLPQSGFLKKLHLPASTAQLILTNQHKIEELECESYANLTTLRIENSTTVNRIDENTVEPTDRFPLQTILQECNINKFSTFIVKDVKWDVSSQEVLRDIMTQLISRNRSDFVFTGTVYLPAGVTVDPELKTLIHQHFPDLNVMDNDPIFYVDYYKHDGTIWDTEYVRPGQDAQGPSKGNAPSHIDPDVALRYIFVRWDNLPTGIDKNERVVAIWQAQYGISFYDESGKTCYISLYSDLNKPSIDPVMYGVFDGTLPTDKIYEPTKASSTPDTLKYKFNGWALEPNSNESLNELPVVTGVTNFYATFVEQYPVKFYETEEGASKEVQYGDTQWIIKGQDAIRPAANPEKASDIQYNYKFSQWIGNYTNVQKALKIYAKYTSITRKYNVYFCNGNAVLHTASDIDYNTRATYIGSEPEKQLSSSDILYGYTATDYQWTGKWSPEPIPKADTITTKGTGNNKEEAVWCYPVFQFIKVHDDTWDEIADNVARLPEEQLFQRYPIGTRKNLQITLDGKQYKAVAEVIAHNHDDLADGSGNKAKLTFFTRQLPDLEWPLGITRENGWGSSVLRERMNSVLFDGLPDGTSDDGNLQAAIKEVRKAYNILSPQAAIRYSDDKCWAASDKEIAAFKYNANGDIVSNYWYAHTDGQGETYSQAFSDDASRQREVVDLGANGAWWTRSLYSPEKLSTNMAWYVWAMGTCGGVGSVDSMYTTKYVAFGFCI